MSKDKKMIEWMEEIESHISSFIDDINNATTHDHNEYLKKLKLIYSSCSILGNVKAGKTKLVGICYDKLKKEKK